MGWSERSLDKMVETAVRLRELRDKARREKDFVAETRRPTSPEDFRHELEKELEQALQRKPP